uniref:IP5PC-F beta-propeller domain-containing protein n=1 Tax=Ananas comosus var. bracteatus TaxID=296719 RepID=A0A6V7NP25_ANACO|nr:unnamed protein product [Ananas comosus var. bracteatus]
MTSKLQTKPFGNQTHGLPPPVVDATPPLTPLIFPPKIPPPTNHQNVPKSRLLQRLGRPARRILHRRHHHPHRSPPASSLGPRRHQLACSLGPRRPPARILRPRRRHLQPPAPPVPPPSLDLRPRPLRETQAGSFLRAIAAAADDDQIWAAQESGVRFWNLCEAFGDGGARGRARRGDEESAPFWESCRTAPALCLAVDRGRRVVWSGHRDGRILGWRTESRGPLPPPPPPNSSVDQSGDFKECLAWNAHRAPVLSMVVTPYGDLWSGSEVGIVKVWSKDALEHSLSVAIEESHKVSQLVERSYVDLKSLVTYGGVCPLPTVDVKHLLSDNSRSKVWSGGYLSFALWDSRTKELLKVINIDVQVETRFDILSVQGAYEEDDTKINLFSSFKKDKSQSSVSFFQRSRNALIGAADAVRRVAVKAGFGDDNRRIEALAMSMDGTIWTGSANGSLALWDGNGNRLQEFQHHASSILCICTFGLRVWVGYMDGTVHLMDIEGNLIGGWVAHNNPIIKMAVAGLYIFTLANHGGICGWNLSSPGPIDNILQSELIQKETLYSKFEHLKILVGTWNVGQERASYNSLAALLDFSESEVGLVVVGLQEVEMGAGYLAIAAAKEKVRHLFDHFFSLTACIA